MSNNQDSPSEESIKEAYAKFGLAYYLSECIHRGLCNIYALTTFKDKSHITRPRIEEKLSYSFSLTLGQLKNELQGELPGDLYMKIEECLEKRNYLAHHFWFEKIHLMFSDKGVKEVLDNLKEYCRFLSELDDEIEKYIIPKIKEFGVTEKMLQDSMEKSKSGEPFEPLPKKRKPNKKEHLVKVWEFKLPDGSKPLIFETLDGCLWQLCDVGLGWTYYEYVEDDWAENRKINQYLPATIDPRPKDSKPWNYEIKLENKAIIWVKPGSKANTFKWGIKEVKKL